MQDGFGHYCYFVVAIGAEKSQMPIHLHSPRVALNSIILLLSRFDLYPRKIACRTRDKDAPIIR
jgi:hypothetical protein